MTLKSLVTKFALLLTREMKHTKANWIRVNLKLLTEVQSGPPYFSRSIEDKVCW